MVERPVVRVRGDETARRSVILVHGALDRAQSFDRVVRRLSSVRTVTYDRRGYQSSRHISPLSLESHVADLVNVIDQEVLAGHLVTVVGHSYGGLIALNAAAAGAPIDHVLVYEPPLPWLVPHHQHHRTLENDPAKEAEVFFRRVMSDAAWERLSPEGQQSRRDDGPALLDDLQTLRGPRPFDFGDVAVPTLFAYGDGPRASYFAEMGRSLAAVATSVTLSQLTHAGHGAHLSTPDQLAALIRDWSLIP